MLKQDPFLSGSLLNSVLHEAICPRETTYLFCRKFGGIYEILLKNVIQVHLHIRHLPCRSYHVHRGFHAVQKSKYHTAQTELTLLVSLCCETIRLYFVFWSFVNNHAHTEHLFIPQEQLQRTGFPSKMLTQYYWFPSFRRITLDLKKQQNSKATKT